MEQLLALDEQNAGTKRGAKLAKRRNLAKRYNRIYLLALVIEIALYIWYRVVDA